MNVWLKTNLFALCKRHGLTKIEDGEEKINQLAVEERTKVAQTTLSGFLEQGKKPRLDTLEKLAGGLGVDVWQLLATPAVFQASLTPNFADLIEVLSRK